MSEDKSRLTSSDSEKESNLFVEPETMRVSRLKAIEFIGRLALSLVMKFWRICTAAVSILLLIYWLYGGIVVFILLIFAILGLLYNIQDSLLYYPSQPPHSRIYVESPAILGLPFENFLVKTQDGVNINMYLIKQADTNFSTAPTVIYLHGNAGNIGHRLLNAQILHAMNGFNVLLVEYRGYGKSQGTPNEWGLYYDAQASLEYLLKRSDIDKDKIIVFGRSLGGAVAINLANNPKYSKHILALILENTFTSLPDIGRHLFDIKMLEYLPNWCFKNKYPSLSLIKSTTTPTLFLSGLDDNLIPPKMMQDLYNVSGSKMKRMARFETGTHNETWQCQGYNEALNRFLIEVLKGEFTGGEDTDTFNLEVPFNDHGLFNV